jgi:hypothetical protein
MMKCFAITSQEAAGAAAHLGEHAREPLPVLGDCVHPPHDLAPERVVVAGEREPGHLGPLRRCSIRRSRRPCPAGDPARALVDRGAAGAGPSYRLRQSPSERIVET